MTGSSWSAQDDESEFRREGPTALAYLALSCFAFWNYAYGPALALLRGELHFSYGLLGLYTAAWSCGTALTGALFPAVARRLPRAVLLWSAALLASAGATLFALGPGVRTTMAGAVVLGLGGTMLLAALQAILSDRHGDRRDRALTEANIGAAACAVLAPLALGALAVTPLGWRAGFALPVVGLALLYLRFRRQAMPDNTENAMRRPGRLPLACWLFAGLAAASMGVEFCLVYFGAEQLRVTGLSTTVAATAMSAHYLGLLAGRVGGAVATRRPGRSVSLLFTSLVITVLGFLFFWLTSQPLVAVLGLLVAGLGVANLYPLSVALSLTAAPGLEDTANSRSQLLGGLLVITAPYLLGTLADHVGLTAAFAIEPVLIVLSLLLLLAGLHVRRRTAPTSSRLPHPHGGPGASRGRSALTTGGRNGRCQRRVL